METSVQAGPRFYVTPNRRVSPGTVLLAFVIALGVLLFVLFHALHASHSVGGAGNEDDDDPSRIDTIYLGGPSEAPVAKRPAALPSTVHPFIVVHLPRDGDQSGQIPDTTAGRMLYAWLAAFNGTDPSAFARALPSPKAELTEAAQVELRRETGGFTLLSAKEIEPGLLVFRVRDQTVPGTEALGTLQISRDEGPARIASLSLGAVSEPQARLP